MNCGFFPQVLGRDVHGPVLAGLWPGDKGCMQGKELLISTLLFPSLVIQWRFVNRVQKQMNAFLEVCVSRDPGGEARGTTYNQLPNPTLRQHWGRHLVQGLVLASLVLQLPLDRLSAGRDPGRELQHLFLQGQI